MENNFENNNGNNVSISSEDLEILKELRIQKEAKAAEKAKLDARNEKLNTYLADETFKELYNNGLKDMLDKDPNILDSEGTLSASIRLAQEQYKLKQQSNQPVTQQQTSSVKPPLTQTPMTTESEPNEEGVVLQNLSWKQKRNMGLKPGTAIFSSVFPPKNEIKIKQ